MDAGEKLDAPLVHLLLERSGGNPRQKRASQKPGGSFDIEAVSAEVAQKQKVATRIASLEIGEDFPRVTLNGWTGAVRQILDQTRIVLGHRGELFFDQHDRGRVIVAQQLRQGFLVGYHLVDQ